MQAGLEDTRDDLHAAGEARRGRDREGQSRRAATPALPRHPCGDFVGRQRAAFEHEHAARRVLRVAEFREQLLLHARLRAQRPRAHREESSGLIAQPAYCEAMQQTRRVIGPDRARRATARRRSCSGRELDVPEPAHAQLGQRTARRAKPPGTVDAGVDHARAARQSVHGDPQLRRTLDQAIGERPCALVHVEGGRWICRGRSFLVRIVQCFHAPQSLLAERSPQIPPNHKHNLRNSACSRVERCVPEPRDDPVRHDDCSGETLGPPPTPEFRHGRDRPRRRSTAGRRLLSRGRRRQARSAAADRSSSGARAAARNVHASQ